MTMYFKDQYYSPAVPSMTTIATEESYEDPNFERKLDIITAGTCPHIKQHLLTKISRENCKTIVNYVLDFQTEVSPSTTYRIYINTRLKHFSEFHKSTSFKNITRQDIIDYLDSYRKPETIDTLHQWIGTYNTIRICLQRFFRWLYAPDLSANDRPKPSIMENIPKIRRKEVSIYKPTDLWTEEDDALFHKYCPFPRDRYWHAMHPIMCYLTESKGCKKSSKTLSNRDKHSK